MWLFNVDRFCWRNSLFRTVKLIKNANPDKYTYSGYGIDACGSFSVFDGNGLGKYVIIFGAKRYLDSW